MSHSVRIRRFLVLVLVIIVLIFFLNRERHQVSFRQFMYDFDTEIILQRYTSAFSNITVAQSGSLRMLRFDLLGFEGVIHLEQHHLILCDYMRIQLLPLLWNSQPERVLLLGLGAGILPRMLHHLSPHSSIEVVEIDPIIVEIARKYFFLPETPSIQVIVEDGRAYLERQQSNRYDLLIIDVFTTNGRIPHPLRTIECFREYRRVLRSNGLLTMNFLDDDQESHYRHSFARVGPFQEIYRGVVDDNYVFIVVNEASQRLDGNELRVRAERAQHELVLPQFDWREEIRSLEHVHDVRWNRSNR